MTVKIEINGKQITAPAGSMLIEAADNNNIPIPRFCYHKKLSVAANCRMCLVEVDKSRKPLPACATPVTDGMKVWTKSDVAKNAQKAVMEFLLVNHPLDCPICDQGGECELQDLSMGYGADSSRFNIAKTTVADKDIGPLISTYMTRCILCTRCIRFGEEISGSKELGAIGRGAFTEVTTFVEQNLDSEVSGNVIDLCPVGALTNKPFAFKARSWELQSYPSIGFHDCIGSNINIHSRRGIAMRVVPRDNEQVNEAWISDRDRFSINAVNSPNRLKQPLIKQKNGWQSVSWDVVLDAIVKKTKQVIENHGAKAIGGLISPNTTLEEQFLLQKLMRRLGSNNVDHRLRQTDFTKQELFPSAPNLGIKLQEIENQNAVLLVGSNLSKEQPIAALRLRKAQINGANVCVINPVDFSFNLDFAEKIITPTIEIVNNLAGITKAILDKAKTKAVDGIDKLLHQVKPNDAQISISDKILAAENRLILIGSLIESDTNYSTILEFADILAKVAHCKLGILTNGANSTGAWLSGCIPHREHNNQEINTTEVGLNTKEMLEKPLKAYFLANIEPELDTCFGINANSNIKQAEFVVACSSFSSKSLEDIADVILPIASFAETSGTVINCSLDVQSLVGAAKPVGDSRPLWKVLRALGSLFSFSDFEYASSKDVLAEINTDLKFDGFNFTIPTDIKANWNNSVAVDNTDKENKSADKASKKKSGNSFTRVAPVPLYAADMLVRNTDCLQKTNIAINQAKVAINSKMVQELKLKPEDNVLITSNTNKDTDNKVTTGFIIDDRLLDYTVSIPQAVTEYCGIEVNALNLKISKV